MLEWAGIGRNMLEYAGIGNNRLELIRTCWGLSLEHPQGVGIVGIVGTVGIVGIVGIKFCRPKPQPTTPSILVDISSYAYLKEQKLSYT